MVFAQYRARANKRDGVAISGEQTAAVRLRMSLEGPFVFLHPRAARPAPETSQLEPVGKGAASLACTSLPPRPPRMPVGNGAAPIACTSFPCPPLVPVCKGTASLSGCCSSRPPIQRWTRRHRLFVGTVDAAALAGENFGWAPPLRAPRRTPAGVDDHQARPGRALRSTTTSCLSADTGGLRREQGTPTSCPSADAGGRRRRPGTPASSPSVDHHVVLVGRQRRA